MDNETKKELKGLMIDIFKLGYHVLFLIGLIAVLVILIQQGFNMIR
ncbi:hypothetical protein AAK894_12295 [Lachnospiraceae bacterium 46-61]